MHDTSSVATFDRHDIDEDETDDRVLAAPAPDPDRRPTMPIPYETMAQIVDDATCPHCDRLCGRHESWCRLAPGR